MQDLQPCVENNDNQLKEGYINLTREEKLEVLNERMQRFSKEDQEDHGNLEEMILFRQMGTQYAVPIYELNEIRPIAKLTFLPMVNKTIMGVMNVRGRIIPVFALQDVEQQAAQSGFALVGHGIASHMAMWAEEIIGTLKVDIADIKHVPVSLQDKDYIKGIGVNGIVYLDLNKFVNNTKLYMA